MTFIIGLIAFAFVIGTAVAIHELGHFLAARRAGILCHEFAVGMGPIVWRKRKGETLYTIRALPLGGFVLMGQDETEKDLIQEGSEISIDLDASGNVTHIHLDETRGSIRGLLANNTDDVSRNMTLQLEVNGQLTNYPVLESTMYVDSHKDRSQYIVPVHRRLEAKKKWPRFVTMVSGALMNFLLAAIFSLIVGMALGQPVSESTVLSGVFENTPAQQAGLQAGDELVSINNIPLETGADFSPMIQSGEPFELHIMRDGQSEVLTVTPTANEAGHYTIGIQFDMSRDMSFGGRLRGAWDTFASGFTMIVTTLQMLFGGEAGVGDLSGPVGIAQMTTQFAMQGVIPLLFFASLININVGIMNLLPLPALDGGRILFIIIEAIIRRPIPTKFEGIVHTVGFVLLMGLFVFTFFNDIFRLFT